MNSLIKRNIGIILIVISLILIGSSFILLIHNYSTQTKFITYYKILVSNTSSTTYTYENFVPLELQDRYTKRCEGYYERLQCSSEIEDHICHKYRFDIYGMVDNLKCVSVNNNTYIKEYPLKYGLWDIDWRYDYYVKHIYTNQYYLKLVNLTQEKINNIFQFNNTIKTNCDIFYSKYPTEKAIIWFPNEDSSYRGNTAEETCGLLREINSSRTEYNTNYEDKMYLNVTYIILIFLVILGLLFLFGGAIILYIAYCPQDGYTHQNDIEVNL